MTAQRPRWPVPPLVGLVCAAALGACAGDPAPPAAVASVAPLPPEPGVLRLAGSGAMGPMVRALAAAYVRADRGATALTPLVEDSIGTGGGVRAVSDGAVDLGMISRSLSEPEERLGLILFPLGTDAVVIAANQELPVEEISGALLRDLFSGERRSLPDGTPVTVLLRDRAESANLALDAAIPGMAAARARGDRHGFRVIYRDEAMAATLFGSRNAIGLSSLALLHEARMPLKLVRIDGRTPSVDALERGVWPMSRQLWLAARPDQLHRVRPFLDFAGSAEGRALIRAAGYLPAGAAGGAR